MTLSSLLKQSTKPSVLRATGAGVETINKLPASKTGCLSLYISYNSIRSLENISQFRKLKVLLMDFNELSHIDDLDPLSDLKNLQVLHLEGNPVCDLPLWDFHVIKLCPKLRVLNGQKTSEFPYNKSQIRQYLQNETKFHQFLVTSKYVIRVLKLKVLNPACEMSVATKLTQKGMFSNPNFQNEYADKIRFQCTKATADGYFGIMRRKLLNQQKKITALSQNAHVPSKIHSFLLTQVTSLTDFDAFLETMEDIQDAILQIVGLGDGPDIEIQQVKSDNLFPKMRPPDFSSRMNSVTYSETSSRMNQSIHSNLDNLKENGDSFLKTEQKVHQLLEEEEEEIDDTHTTQAVNFNSSQNFPEIEADSNQKSQITTRKIEPIDDHEINESMNIVIDGNEEENANEMKSNLLSETDSDAHNGIQNGNEASLSENSQNATPIPEIAHSENFRQKKTKNNRKENLSDPPESPQKKLQAKKSKENYQAMNAQKIRNANLNENPNNFIENSHDTNDSKENQSNSHHPNSIEYDSNENQSNDLNENINQTNDLNEDNKNDLNEDSGLLNENLSHSDDLNVNSDQLLSDDQYNEEEAEHQTNLNKQMSRGSFSSNAENTNSDIPKKFNKKGTEQSTKSISISNIKKTETEEASDERLEDKKNEEELNDSNSFIEEDKQTNKINYIENMEDRQLQEFNLIDEEETKNENLIENNEDETKKLDYVQNVEEDQSNSLVYIRPNSQSNQIDNYDEQQSNQIQNNNEPNQIKDNNINQIDLNQEETLNEVNSIQNSQLNKHSKDSKLNVENKEDKQHRLNYIENIEDANDSFENIEESIKNEQLNAKDHHFIQNLQEDEDYDKFNIKPTKKDSEEEDESEGRKRRKKGKVKNCPTFSEIDTEYAQSLSEPDGSLRSPSNLTQNKPSGQFSEDQFYFEKSQKSFEDNENYSSASISNDPRSILKKRQQFDETEKVFRASRSISFSNVNEKDQLKNSESQQFDASCEKCSEFNDARQRTIQYKMMPISYNSLLRYFSLWKENYRKRIEYNDEVFSRYVDLQNELKEVQQNIKKKKEQQIKAACNYETERGSQLREISLKQELRRKIEHQKDINLALQRRFNQLVKENESAQDFMHPREKESSSSSIFGMNSINNAQRSVKKRKLRDNVTSQYYSMLRNGK